MYINDLPNYSSIVMNPQKYPQLLHTLQILIFLKKKNPKNVKFQNFEPPPKCSKVRKGGGGGQRSGTDTIRYHIRPRIPHGKVTKTQFNTTIESQEVSPSTAGDDKAAMIRCESMTNTGQK